MCKQKPSEAKRQSAAGSNSTAHKTSNNFHRGLLSWVLPRAGYWLGIMPPLPVVATVNLEKLRLNIQPSRKRIGLHFSATPVMHLLTPMYEDWSAIGLILTRAVIGAAREKCNLKSIKSDTKVTPIS